MAASQVVTLSTRRLSTDGCLLPPCTADTRTSAPQCLALLPPRLSRTPRKAPPRARTHGASVWCVHQRHVDPVERVWGHRVVHGQHRAGGGVQHCGLAREGREGGQGCGGGGNCEARPEEGGGAAAGALGAVQGRRRRCPLPLPLVPLALACLPDRPAPGPGPVGPPHPTCTLALAGTRRGCTQSRCAARRQTRGCPRPGSTRSRP